MKKTIIGKAGAILVSVVFAISMYGGAVLAEDLGQSHTLTVPGETPALYFEFNDSNPATPPVVIEQHSIKDVTLNFSVDATNPADVATVIGQAATKCAASAKINQLITVNLDDAGGSLQGALSWEERNSNEEVTNGDAEPHSFGGGVDEDGGTYTMSLCVR